ncbi:DMT family transporter [Methylocystis bryophila]|uniref:EamA domain-containing protein n=1 Tax=Methylocystis bryophila TaxID=655015 RepID=A0A1W6MYE1_9HYPH|nr:DMT family transporter [Methylocystis bryophila]ARN82583.1 hypothetical protein B1812_17490 [Methylocystis bryophila]BDV38794.1 peptide ABC transporter permease [Methylocystis bryophila]
MSAPETASVLIVSSGFLHAIVNSLLKAGKDKLSGRALIDGFSALLVAPLALVTPFPTGAWNWLALAWVVRLFYLVSLVNAFQHLDLLVAYPIARGVAPLLAAAAAVAFFNEPISGAVLCGALLVSFGILAIGGARGVDRRALGWSLLNGGCVALYTVIDAQGVRAAPSAESYIVWTFIGLGCGVSAVFALWRGPAFLVAAVEQWRPGLVAGALSVLSYGAALAAFRLGATPRLASLRESSILFATLIAVVFLGERLTRARAFGIGAIAAGAATLLFLR